MEPHSSGAWVSFEDADALHRALCSWVKAEAETHTARAVLIATRDLETALDGVMENLGLREDLRPLALKVAAAQEKLEVARKAAIDLLAKLEKE